MTRTVSSRFHFHAATIRRLDVLCQCETRPENGHPTYRLEFRPPFRLSCTHHE
jgi:hypothetical protein